MKKYILTVIIATALLATLPAVADDNRPINTNELPAKAQQFISKHFAGLDVSYATVDTEFFDKDYKVVFVNGAKVKFDKGGNWQEVDCKRDGVPADVIPARIQSSARQRFPQQRIVQIEQDSRGYEVELANGVELKFDRSFRMTGIDD